MSYMIKDVFYTIQGEGANAGRAAVFVRFAGCNLWSGRPEDRERGRGACAEWCDTAFVGGERMSGEALERKMFEKTKLHDAGGGLCVLTGGEPALQIDRALIEHLHSCGWEVAVETNGSVANEALSLVDHLCVSPKRGAALLVRNAHELKVVLPGASARWTQGWTDEELHRLADSGEWKAKYVQPQDVPLSSGARDTVLSLGGECKDWQDQLYEHNEYVRRCVAWVKRHPSWRLSLQTHKYIGVE